MNDVLLRYLGDSTGAVRASEQTAAGIKGVGAAANTSNAHVANIGKSAEKSGNQMAGMGKQLVGLAAGLIGLQVGIKAFEGIVHGAESANSANRLLAVTMKDVGLDFKALNPTIQTTIAHLSDLGGFTKVELTNSFTSFVRVTKDASKAQTDLALAVDVARARHVDLSTATAIVVKAQIGMVGLLRRIGIDIKPVTAAVDALKASGEKYTKQQLDQAKAADKAATSEAALAALHSKTAGAAGAATTASEHLHATIANLEASIGKALIPEMEQAADKLNDWATSLEHNEKLHQQLRDAMKLVGDAFRILKGAIDLADKVTGGFVKTLEILLGLKIVWELNEWASAMELFGAATIQTEAEVAGSTAAMDAAMVGSMGRLAKLRALLLGFGGLAAIAMVTIIYRREIRTEVDKFGNWLSKNMPGGSWNPDDLLGHIPGVAQLRDAKFTQTMMSVLTFGTKVETKDAKGDLDSFIKSLPKNLPFKAILVIAAQQAAAAGQQAFNDFKKAWDAAMKGTGVTLGPGGYPMSPAPGGPTYTPPGGNVPTGAGLGAIYPKGTKVVAGGGPGGKWGPNKGTHNQTDWQSANAIDLMAKPGTPVLSPCNGQVTQVSGSPGVRHSGTKVLIGYGVTIHDPETSQTYYIAHIENVSVAEGDTVNRGDQIGTVDPDAGHVHFAVEQGNPALQLNQIAASKPGKSGKGGAGGKPQTPLQKAQTAQLQAEAVGDLPGQIAAWKEIVKLQEQRAAALKGVAGKEEQYRQALSDLISAKGSLASAVAQQAQKTGPSQAAKSLAAALKADKKELAGIITDINQDVGKKLLDKDVAADIKQNAAKVQAEIAHGTVGGLQKIQAGLKLTKAQLQQGLKQMVDSTELRKQMSILRNDIDSGLIDTKLGNSLFAKAKALSAKLDSGLLRPEDFKQTEANAKAVKDKIAALMKQATDSTQVKADIAALNESIAKGILPRSVADPLIKQLREVDEELTGSILSDADRQALEKRKELLEGIVKSSTERMAEQEKIVTDDIDFFHGVIEDARKAIGASVATVLTPADLETMMTSVAGLNVILKDKLLPQETRDAAAASIGKYETAVKNGIDALVAQINEDKQKVAEAWTAFGDFVIKTFDEKVANKFQNNLDLYTAAFSAKELTQKLSEDEESYAEAIKKGSAPLVAAMDAQIQLWKDYEAALARGDWEAVNTLQNKIVAGEAAIRKMTKGLEGDQAEAANAVVNGGNEIIADIKQQGDVRVQESVKTWKELSDKQREAIKQAIAAAQDEVNNGEPIEQAMKELRQKFIDNGLSPEDADGVLADPITGGLVAAVNAFNLAMNGPDGLVATLGKLIEILDKITLPDPTKNLAGSVHGNAQQIIADLMSIRAAYQGTPVGETGNANYGGLQMHRGGIVPFAHAYSGLLVPGPPKAIDYVPILANGGEMILAGPQQMRLWRMLNGAAPGGGWGGGGNWARIEQYLRALLAQSRTIHFQIPGPAPAEDPLPYVARAAQAVTATFASHMGDHPHLPGLNSGIPVGRD